MAKSVNIFNKGKRTFQLAGGVSLAPNKAAKIDADIAANLLEKYPREVIKAGSVVVDEGDEKKLKATIVKLNAALDKSEELLLEATEALSAAETKAESLETALDAATQPEA